MYYIVNERKCGNKMTFVTKYIKKLRKDDSYYEEY